MQLNFTINIDERIVNFFKRICTRRNVVTFIITAVIGTSIFVYAQVADLTVFESGTVISSADVNANFAALAAKGTVVDADDQNLGYFLYMIPDATAPAVTLLSPTGYMYPIKWTGEIYPNHDIYVYFTSTFCTGTPYVLANGTSGVQFTHYSKLITREWDSSNGTELGTNAKFKNFAPVLNGGIPVYKASQPVQSRIQSPDWLGNTCKYYNTTISNVIEMQEMSSSDIGIPATITPPLTIKQ